MVGRDGEYHPACPKGKECCKCGPLAYSYKCINAGAVCDDSWCPGDGGTRPSTTSMEPESTSSSSISTSTTTTTMEPEPTSDTSTSAAESTASSTESERTDATTSTPLMAAATTTFCTDESETGVGIGEDCKMLDTCCNDELGNNAVCLGLFRDPLTTGVCRSVCGTAQDESRGDGICVSVPCSDTAVCPDICGEACRCLLKPNGDFDGTECGEEFVSDPKSCPESGDSCCGCDCDAACQSNGSPPGGGFIPPWNR